MESDLLIGLLSGILAGWTVAIFSDTYREFKQRLIRQLKPGAKLSKAIIEALLPSVFLLLMFISVLLVFYVGSSR